MLFGVAPTTRSNQAMQLTALRFVFLLRVATTFFLAAKHAVGRDGRPCVSLGGEVKPWLLLTRHFH